MSATPLRIHTTPPAESLDCERLIDVVELCKMLSIGRSTAERLKARGALPPHIALSRTCHRWRLGTVIAWLRDREQSAH